MSSANPRGEELVFALQQEIEHLKSRLKELMYINQEHKHLNGLLRAENDKVSKEFSELKAKVNIKVMNGQWHMSNTKEIN